MVVLPLIERELRVAARRRSTFWLRVATALVALVIAAGFMILAMVESAGLGPLAMGKALFATLTWLCLASVLTAGAFLTSDCLSEEKREGTLGLLFLTDLRGYDVVLGKLVATSLRGAYALLSVFPILAITLLMGGVTGVEFWKTVLALINALFFSLSAGLFVSALSRDSQRALGGTLILLVLLVAGGPVADAIIAGIHKRAFDPAMSLMSPGFLFVTAGSWGQAQFWPALLVNQAVAWLCLMVTCVLLPRSWQEKASKPMAMGTRVHSWKFGGARRRTKLRQKLVAENPVLWLACRERWQAVSMWIVTVLLLGAFAALVIKSQQSMGYFILSYASGLLSLCFYLGAASQAGRLFVEAKRGGLLELMLATPLTVGQMVGGPWRAFLRMFGLPLLVCLALQFTGVFLAQRAMWSLMAGATATASATTSSAATTNLTVTATNGMVIVMNSGSVATSPGAGTFSVPSLLLPLTMSIFSTLTVVANLVALVWFGMWMGMTSKNTNLASLKTIVFVQIIPWFVVVFASNLVIPLLGLLGLLGWMGLGGGLGTSPNFFLWYQLVPAVMGTVLFLGKDLAFTLWARRKLFSDFRERAAQAVAPVRVTWTKPGRQIAPPIVHQPGRV